MNKQNNLAKVFHIIFDIGILIKFIDGFIEVITALMLFVMGSNFINYVLDFVFHNELIEDPNDIFANNLINLAHSLSVKVVVFIALYLFIHGLIKIIIVLALWKGKISWYPAVGAIMLLMVLYQAYKIILSHSFFLIVITSIDVIILILLRNEYIMLKNKISG